MAKVNKGLRDVPRSQVPNDNYLNNYDNIFKKQEKHNEDGTYSDNESSKDESNRHG